MNDLDLIKKQTQESNLRGEPITFADGRKWVIRSKVIGTPSSAPIKVALSALQGIANGGSEDEAEQAIQDFCFEAVRVNYPDVNKDEIVVDFDCYAEVMNQYNGGNSAKKVARGLT